MAIDANQFSFQVFEWARAIVLSRQVFYSFTLKYAVLLVESTVQQKGRNSLLSDTIIRFL